MILRTLPLSAFCLLLTACPPEKGDTGATPDPDPIDTSVTDSDPPVDGDGDGLTVADGDCDDADPAVRPGAPEACNGADDNCNVRVDEGFGDGDSDGIADCLDVEGCDGVDNDGDGLIDEGMPDGDGDGIGDCVDVEGCDGVDNDGDGIVDEGFDLDGDGAIACLTDCDDADAAILPGAAEITDDRDNDCDGATDEHLWRAGDLVITEVMVNPAAVADIDGEWVEVVVLADGPRWINGLVVQSGGAATIAGAALIRVEPGDRLVLAAHLEPALNGGVEADLEAPGLLLSNEGGALSLIMDGLLIDEIQWAAGAARTGASYALDPFAEDSLANDGADQWCDGVGAWAPEADAGTPGEANPSCPGFDHDGDGFTGLGGDCDDGDAAIFPGSAEIPYDGVDQDCDGVSDLDADRDGYEADVFGGGDCDDLDPSANPGAVEVCDALNVDEDCDGAANLDDLDIPVIPLWYPDGDGDGYGDDGAAYPACEEPGGHFTAAGGDCDDEDPAIRPGVVEICANGVDDNCDGERGGCGLGGEIDGVEAAATLDGLNLSGLLGGAVASAGDLDGDGDEELAVSATGEGNRGNGVTYLLYGPLSGAMDTSGATVRLLGPSNESTGNALLGGSDVSGDGLPDLWIGAQNGGAGAGAVYRIDGGSPSGNLQTLAAASLTGAASGDGFGVSMAWAGDLDDDGADDLWIGANNAGPRRTDGAVYLFSGAPAGARTTSDAALTLTAEGNGDDAGRAVAGGMDCDGDGIGDLIIGAPEYGTARSPEGRVYVVSGDTAGGSLSAADAIWDGTTAANAGVSVAWIGDVDGDGLADALIGGPADTTAGVGTAWLLLDPLAGGSLSTADGALVDSGSGQRVGGSVAGLGDVDGDGRPDFAVGAPASSLSGIQDGAAFLFYAPFTGTLSTDDAPDVLTGIGSGQFGHSLAGLDSDGDGYQDIAGGMWQASTYSTSAGGALLFLGGPGW